MSYASMVPDKLQSELIQIRDDMTRAYWRIGDICQEVKDYLIFNEQRAIKVVSSRMMGGWMIGMRLM